MLRKIARKASEQYPFGPDDFLQQIVGSAILSAPLLVTQEVWQIAQSTSIVQSTLSILATFLLGYGILYVEKHERDFDVERDIAGIKLRYISLMFVTFGTPLFLLTATATAGTLGSGLLNTVKVISFVSTFAVIGAATADNLI
ncbi:MAG: DUF2391 domain-containing protein [Candidatus Aenigmatarchaeota archaeon]